MLTKIKQILGLLPKGIAPMTKNDGTLQIQVGVENNKMIIKLDRHVDVITFDKVQLSSLLAALASRASELK